MDTHSPESARDWFSAIGGTGCAGQPAIAAMLSIGLHTSRREFLYSGQPDISKAGTFTVLKVIPGRDAIISSESDPGTNKYFQALEISPRPEWHPRPKDRPPAG